MRSNDRSDESLRVLAVLCASALSLAACSDKEDSADPQVSGESAFLDAAEDADEPVDDMVQAVVYDYGFGAPVKAATLNVPEKWQTRGGIQWNERIECVANSVRVEWSATSRDTRRAIELLPGFNWQIAGYDIPMNPCPVAPISSAREYLEALARELYPGAQVLSYRDRADLAAESQAKAPPTQNSTVNGAQMSGYFEAGEMGLQYEMAGRDVEEIVMAVVNFTQVIVPGVRPSRMGGVSNVYVVRAPAGKLDKKMAEQVRASFRVDEQWQAQAVAYATQRSNAHAQAQLADIRRWHERRMAEISARGEADRAAIRSQTIRDIGEINAAGWKSRQQSLDRMHRDNVDTIREVNRYHDPTRNQQVELSSHYNHGWRTDDGRYIATDDPNFNPSRDLGVNGEEMERVR